MLAAKACEPHREFVAFAMQFPRATNPRCSETSGLVGSLTAIAPEHLPIVVAAPVLLPRRSVMIDLLLKVGPVGLRSVLVFGQWIAPGKCLVSVFHHSASPNEQVGAPGSVEATLALRPPDLLESYPNIAKPQASLAERHPKLKISLETGFRSRFAQAP